MNNKITAKQAIFLTVAVALYALAFVSLKKPEQVIVYLPEKPLVLAAEPVPEPIRDTMLFMMNSDRCKGEVRTALSPLAKEMLAVQTERIMTSKGGKQYEKEAFITVMCQETKYRKNMVSPANAYGLTQMILSTAQMEADRLGMGKITPEDLFDPEISLTLGYSHFLYLLRLPEINGNIARAWAAYNGGTAGKTSKNMKLGMVGAAETDAYVTSNADMMEQLRLRRENKNKVAIAK